MSDRVASEVRRVSVTLNERVAEAERAMQISSYRIRRSPTFLASAMVFGTIQRDVRAGAIRVEISGPDQFTWRCRYVQNQEAKKVREIGSLIFDSPLQYD